MTRPAPDQGELLAALSRMLGAVQEIVPIESGTNGTSYRVQTADGLYAAKVLYPDADVLCGPAQQLHALTALAPTTIAPRPVGVDEELRLLVTEWISDGCPATPRELADGQRLTALVRTLRALHATASDIPAYRPDAYQARYIDALGGLPGLTAHDRSRHAEVIDLAAELAASPEPRGLCHNDLLAENLFFGSSCRVIDFDFAATGPPMLDLASVASMNRLDDGACRALLQAYYGEYASRAAEFARVRRLVALLAHFWALASAYASEPSIAQYRMEND